MSCKPCNRTRNRRDKKSAWVLPLGIGAAVLAGLLAFTPTREALAKGAASVKNQVGTELGTNKSSEDLLIVLLDASEDSLKGRKAISKQLLAMVEGLSYSPRMLVYRYARREEQIFDGHAASRDLRKTLQKDFENIPVPSEPNTMLALPLGAAERIVKEHRAKFPSGRISILIGSIGSIQDIPECRAASGHLASAGVQCIAFGLQARLNTPGETAQGHPAYLQLRVIEQHNDALRPFRSRGAYQLVTQNDFGQKLPDLLTMLNPPVPAAKAGP